MPTLFDPLVVGDWRLPNRVVLAHSALDPCQSLNGRTTEEKMVAPLYGC